MGKQYIIHFSWALKRYIYFKSIPKCLAKVETIIKDTRTLLFYIDQTKSMLCFLNNRRNALLNFYWKSLSFEDHEKCYQMY